MPECRAPEPVAGYPLRLVRPKARLRVHSQGANIAWFMEQEPPALWMHPFDAGARDIADGQLVTVSSPQGRVHIATRVGDKIMPGVVCLLEGA